MASSEVKPKKSILIAVDLGNTSTKVTVDILKGTVESSGQSEQPEQSQPVRPKCFQNGPVYFDLPTNISYSGGTFAGWKSNKLTSKPGSHLCDDFVWPLISRLAAIAKTEPIQKPAPVWQRSDTNIDLQVDDLVGDYLNCIYKYLEKKSVEQLWARGQFQWVFVFSIPASFEDDDIANFNKILEIWNKTKGHRYMMKRQPEAAAISVIHSIHQAGDEIQYKFDDLTKNQRTKAFLICDIGGKKMEITSFHLKFAGPDTLLVPERTIIKSSCDPSCGSNVIDNGFLELLRRGIPNPKREKFKEGSQDETKSLDSFISQKNKLVTRDDINVPLFGVGLEHEKNNSGFLCITENDLAGFIDPCSRKTVTSLRKHIQTAKDQGIDIELVFLVGGLAKSEIFQTQVRHGLINMEQLSIWIPEAPEAAVSKGMILDLQQPSYGITTRYGYVEKTGKILWLLDKNQGLQIRTTEAFEQRVRRSTIGWHFKVRLARYRGEVENRPPFVSDGLELDKAIFQVNEIKVPIRRLSKDKKSVYYRRRALKNNFLVHYDISKYGIESRIKSDNSNKADISETYTWGETE